MGLYQRIKQLCDERGITGYRLCQDIQISKSTLTDLKMGRKKSLSAEVASKIADYFGVTTGHLLYGAPAPKAPTLTQEDERDIIRQADALLAGLDNSQGLMLDGKPASAEAVELFRDSVIKGIRDARLINRLKHNE